MTGVVVQAGSRAALHFGAREAAARGCRLTVVHAWDAPVTITLDSTALPGTNGRCATFLATDGPLVDGLLAQVPDIVVVARRRAGSLGAFGRRVLHRAACTTVIVPDEGAGEIRRVVVGSNRSPAAGAAERWAGQEAAVHGAGFARVEVPSGSPLDHLLLDVTPDDLLTVGHRRHCRLGRAVRAHLAAELAALAPCPVALVPFAGV